MSETFLANRYRLGPEIGRGAMGIVYRAQDEVLNRDVAVKLVPEAADDPQRRARLVQEARAAARLNHPGIVAVYDAGESAEAPYLVMELVEGTNLREDPPSTMGELVDMAMQLCAALAHAHHAGVIHRDLKPENILVTRNEGRPLVKLADLGLSHSRIGMRLTQDGTLLGTPIYMAPEQALGAAPDGRSDLYALGIILYERACGRPPFTGDDPLMIVAAHIHAPVVPPRSHSPRISAELEAVILRLLAKSPEDRFADAAAAAEALAACRESVSAMDAGDGAEESLSASSQLLDILARGRLVGRRDELQKLREHWMRGARGQAQLVLVSGEPGVGKTRLAREVVVFARLSGATVLSGGCYEFEGTTPYLPFREVMRSWVRGQTAEELRARLGSDAAELARLAPEIEQKLGPLPALPPLPAAEERFRLFETLSRFFEERCGEKGLMLFLDDLHWSDPGTLALLQHLMRRLREARFMVLGAYREAELDRKHPLATALVDWNRERLATRIALDRMTAEETAALLGTLLDQDNVSVEMVDAIHRETGGNPFFLEEVVKSLIEQGAIYRAAGGWHRKSISELAIPQSVKEAIGRRLDRLSETCTETLQSAAGLGKAFEFSDLATTLALPEDGVITAIEEAEAAQLIRSEGGERFVFTHDKIREVLYLELSPIRRRRLHQKIGEALETRHARRIEERVADLAYHFTQSGDLARSLDYSRRAARAAERVHALEEAVNHALRGIEAARGLGLEDEILESHRLAGRLLRGRGQPAAAASQFQEALALAGDGPHRAPLLAELGATVLDNGRIDIIPLLEEAIERLDPATQPEELARALMARARFHHHQLRHGFALELLQRALPLAERGTDYELLAHLHGYTAGALQHLGRLGDSEQLARRSVALGERLGSLIIQASGWEFIAEALAMMGRWREAVDAGERDEALGRKCGDMSRLAWSAFARTVALQGGGRLAEAAAMAETASARAAEIGETRLGMFIHSVWLENAICRGVTEIDLGPIESALDSARRGGLPLLEGLLCGSLSLHHLVQGRVEEARRISDHARSLFEATDNNTARLFVGPFRLEILLAQGELDTAESEAADLLRVARLAPTPLRENMALLFQGRIALERGRLDEAAAAFDEAVAGLTELDARLELGRAHRHRARLHARRGHAEAAHRDRRRAEEILTEAGAVWDLALLASDRDHGGPEPGGADGAEKESAGR